MSYLEVAETESNLRRVSWQFYYDSRLHRLVPVKRLVESRPSTRHKFRIEDAWSQYGRHKEPVPQIPEDVKSRIINIFTSGLTVGYRED